MPKPAIGESPFSLAFGTEAVLPPKVVFPTPRIKNFEEGTTDKGLHANLDLVEERRADAHLRTLAYKKTIAELYNRKVCPRPIKLSNLVLRKAEVSDPTCTRGKLAPSWEGPYRVAEVFRDGTYCLTMQEGDQLPRT